MSLARDPKKSYQPFSQTSACEERVLWESLRRQYAIWHFIRYERIASIIVGADGDELLDVGSGIGLLDLLISNKIIVGIDIDRGNIREAMLIRKNNKLENGFQPLIADLYSLPLKTEFDWVTCLEVLEHLADDRKALNSLASVLRKGGRLVITLPNLLRLELPQLFRLALRPKHLYPGHLREYTINDVHNLVRSSPLKIEKITGVYLDFPLFHILNMPTRAFMSMQHSTKSLFFVYNAFFRIYSVFWVRLERLFWHHAYYILVILRKHS